MRISAKFFAGMLITVFLVSAMMPSHATGPYYGLRRSTKMTTKLGRGILNTVFCWVEIPLTMDKEIKETDPFTGFWVGLGVGSKRAGKRLVSGVWDMISFPANKPAGYEPILIDIDFPMMDRVE